MLIKKYKNDYLIKTQKICLYINEICKVIDFGCTSNIFLTNKEEINDLIIILRKELSFFKYLYKYNIENTLHSYNDYIDIQKDNLNEIKYYLYLDKLKRENKNIINCNFEISLIREINEKNKKVIENIFSKIMISRIILELIDNYRKTSFFQESEINELNEIKYYNIEEITKKIEILKDLDTNFNIDYIINTSIDEIYLDIIINLIERNRLCDDKYIIIGKIMIVKLNLYNFLFKYIKKNIFYKYQIEFLNEMTKITRYLIKKNFQPYEEKKIGDIKEKFYFFIKSMNECQYYLNLLYNNEKINNINISYDSSTFLTNKIYSNEPIYIKQKEKEEFNGKLIEFSKKLLNNSTFLIKNNENGELILSILKDEPQDNMEIFDDIDIDFAKLKYNVYKLIDFLSIIKDKIKENFQNIFNLIVKIKIFNTSYYLNSNDTYNIDCYYIFYPPNSTSKVSFKDDNILVNGINGKCQGFYYLINEINDDCYKKIIFNRNLDINDYINKIDNLDEKPEKFDEKKIKDNSLSLIDIGKLSGVSELKVLEMKTKLDTNLDSVDFLEQLSNGFFLAGGNCKTLCIYNKCYEKIKQIDLPNYPISTEEITPNDENYLEIVIFLKKKEIILISLNKFDFTYKTENYDTNFYIFLILSNNNYIYSDDRGTFLSTNLLENNENKKEEKISIYSYKYGIELDKNLILLIANSFIPEGKDNLILYDKCKKENVYELEGYSYNISKNSFLLMKNRIYQTILCACKNNTKYQKNGILLLNSPNKNSQDTFNTFYDTSLFELYSFCDLKYIYKTEKEIKTFETNYFLVGGFDIFKGVGSIKLYKIIHEYKDYNTKIECIEDIIFKNDNFFEFEGPITSLIQSKETGEILSSCRDGTIYLLSPPNLNYFIYYDEQETPNYSYILKNFIHQ